jgi:hypothetical protein
MPSQLQAQLTRSSCFPIPMLLTTSGGMSPTRFATTVLETGRRIGLLGIITMTRQRLRCRRKITELGRAWVDKSQEIAFNNLQKNNTTHREQWCNWALSGKDDTCQPFYYLVYEEPDPEVEGSQLKAKVCSLVPLFTLLGYSPLMLFLLGYFLVAAHCCHFWNTHSVALSDQGR